MQEERQTGVESKHVRNIPSEWGTGQSDYICTDDTHIAVPNRAFRQSEHDEDGFVSTDHETIFMNRIVYRRTEENTQSRTQLFIAQSEFDRSISAIVKGAETVRTIAFTGTTREIRSRAFEKNECLKSVVLSEGLERIEGGSNNEQHGGAFCNTRIKKIEFPATLKELGNRTFQNCGALKRAIFREGSKLEKIGNYCFASTDLEEIALPKTLKDANGYAFADCGNLKVISVENGCSAGFYDTRVSNSAKVDLPPETMVGGVKLRDLRNC